MSCPKHLLAGLLLSIPALALSAEQLVNDTPLPPAPLRPDPQQRPPLGDFGGAGLLQTPTARFGQDGDVAFTWHESDPYRFFSVNAQVLPGFEATARYVLVKGLTQNDGGDYVDKGIDLKFRLLQETRWQPALALGLRDIAGTGLFAGEQLTASKRFGDLDASLGLGWGYGSTTAGFSNPLCRAATHFCSRGTDITGNGGNVEFNKFFTGPVGVFGGVSWQTPWQPLRVLAELDGNDYRRELVAGDLKARSPFNLGLLFQAAPGVDLRLGHERGDTLTVTLSLRSNLHRLRQAHLEAPATPWGPAASQPAEPAALAQRLEAEAGYRVSALARRDDTLVVQAEQLRYRDTRRAEARAWPVLQAATAPDITAFALEEQRQGVTVTAVQADRAALAQALEPSDQPLPLASAVLPASAQTPAEVFWRAPPSTLRLSLDPYLSQGFGGVDNFYFYDLGARATAAWQPGASELRVSALASLLNNYDGFRTDPKPTDLPQVRTRIRDYLNQPLKLDVLQASHRVRLGEDWFAQGYAGYLELMFAGAGGEVLYRPAGSRWAVGLDVNHVRQRDPFNELGLLPYGTTTGHLTTYVHFPEFHDVRLKVATGRFLAGDIGTHVDVSRRFASGMTLGAFAARTNVSAEQFGEGSFHKGLYLSIPLDLVTVRNTRTTGTLTWVPIQRDGGQMLNRATPLWSLTESRSLP